MSALNIPLAYKIAVIVFVSASLVFILNLIIPKSTHNSQQPPKAIAEQEDQTAIVFGVPVRLKVPKIKVDARVSLMGLTKDGDMEAPEGGQDVGWYKVGARPGNNGTAVIAGHYGQWQNGEGSVFDNLNKLEKGDIIYVEDEHGASVAFVVRELKTYKQGEVDPAVFNFSSDGKAYLNLITCQGTWNKNQNTYSDRLVVFADKKISL